MRRRHFCLERGARQCRVSDAGPLEKLQARSGHDDGLIGQRAPIQRGRVPGRRPHHCRRPRVFLHQGGSARDFVGALSALDSLAASRANDFISV